MGEAIKAKIRASFKAADQNGDGFINIVELKNTFRQLGDWTEEKLDELFKAADQNADDKLVYDEFLDWVMSGGSEEVAAAAKAVHTLSLLVVKKWDDDQAWAGDLGPGLFKPFGIPGSQCQVASFWAIIRNSSVDLFKMSAEYDMWADDPNAEIAKFLVENFPLEQGEDQWEERSSRLLEIFTKVYDIVAACGAPVHGLVYVGHGNGDGAMFECMLMQEDTRKLLAHANAVLGRRIDVVDFSGNCNEGSLVNLANVGPYCRYFVASEFPVGGYSQDEVLANDGLMSQESIRRSYLCAPEYSYHLLNVKGKSVLSMLMKRVAADEEFWQACSKDMAEKGCHASTSIYCTKTLQEFLAASGELLAGDGPALLSASKVEVTFLDSSYVFYDMKTLIGNDLEEVFNKVRPVYRHSGEADAWPALNGMYARPAAVMKLVAAYDGLSDEERNAKYTDAGFDESSLMESQPFNDGIRPGLLSEGALPYGEEPFFPADDGSAPTGKEFTLDTIDTQNFCIKAEPTDPALRDIAEGTLVKINDQEIKVQMSCFIEGSYEWYFQTEDQINEGGKPGDTMSVVYKELVGFDEVGDDIKALLEW